MERSSALIWGVMGLKNRFTLQEKLYWSDNCDLEDQKAGGEEGGREWEREAGIPNAAR